MKRTSAAAIALLFLVLSCRNTALSYGPRMLDSGLTIQELVVPDGPAAAEGDEVKIHYHGTLPNNQVFDSSVERGQPLSFVIGSGQVPPGLDQGVRGMHLYGRRKLIAPIELIFPDGAPTEFAGTTRVDIVVELLEITGAQ